MRLSTGKRPVHRGSVAAVPDLYIVPGTRIYAVVHLWYIYTLRGELYVYNTPSTRYHLPVACKGDIDLFDRTRSWLTPLQQDTEGQCILRYYIP